MTQLAKGEALYRIGVNANCPVHGVCLAGQNFTRMSEKVSGDGAATLREPMRGSIVIMGAGQLKRCHEAAKHKRIRVTSGKRSRARIVDVRSKRFRAVESDLPVANFVYAELVTAANDPHAEVKRPTFSDGEGFDEADEAPAVGVEPKVVAPETVASLPTPKVAAPLAPPPVKKTQIKATKKATKKAPKK